MAIRKMGGTYYVYFRDIDGRIVTRSLKTGNKELAEKLHKSFMLKLQAKKGSLVIMRNFPEQFKETPPATIAPPKIKRNANERGSIQLDCMLELAESRRTWTDKKRRAETWKRFTDDIPCQYADEVTPQIALDYLNRKYGKMSGKTYNNVKTSLNSIFKLCLVESGLQQSPFEIICNRKVENVEHHRAFTTDEFLRIFAAAVEPWKSAALISWYTALRKETCFRLAWDHINTEDKSITIMPGKTARFGRAVYIPIHPQLWQHLQSLPRPESDSAPILSQWKAHIRHKIYPRGNYFAGLLKELQINDTAEGKASFHSIRASFVTRCDENGISRRATRGIAGHTSDNMTDLYSHDKETAKQILSLPVLPVKKGGEV